MIGIEEREAVLRVMDRGILSDYQGNWSRNFMGGIEVQSLEFEWSRYFKVRNSIACNSNSSGLWMALNAIGIEPFDEVIVTPYSMTISATIPLHFGAIPVFADIEPDYFCLDPKDVEKKITESTKAIIVVDLFGQPYAAQEINRIAEEYSKKYGHKIYVIEDAAQAPGAKYKGKYAGTLGDIGVFSLNRHKHIHCGEGGICVTDNDELALRLRLSMNHAEAVLNDLESKGVPYSHTNQTMIGMNLRMPELSAAIAREQLKKLKDIVEKHQEDSKYFPIKVREDCEHSFYRYAWKDKELSRYIRDDFNFKSAYITPIYQMPLFRGLLYPPNLAPVCEKVNSDISLAWQKKPY